MRPSFFRYDPENSAFSLSLSRKTSDKLTQTLTELINEQAGKETGTVKSSILHFNFLLDFEKSYCRHS